MRLSKKRNYALDAAVAELPLVKAAADIKPGDKVTSKSDARSAFVVSIDKSMLTCRLKSTGERVLITKQEVKHHKRHSSLDAEDKAAAKGYLAENDIECPF